VEDIMKNGTKQKRIKGSSWKIIGKEERPQRNSWFDEECQILFKDKKQLQQNDKQEHQTK
jgi:hypothetical protein